MTEQMQEAEHQLNTTTLSMLRHMPHAKVLPVLQSSLQTLHAAMGAVALGSDADTTAKLSEGFKEWAARVPAAGCARIISNFAAAMPDLWRELAAEVKETRAVALEASSRQAQEKLADALVNSAEQHKAAAAASQQFAPPANVQTPFVQPQPAPQGWGSQPAGWGVPPQAPLPPSPGFLVAPTLQHPLAAWQSMPSLTVAARPLPAFPVDSRAACGALPTSSLVGDVQGPIRGLQLSDGCKNPSGVLGSCPAGPQCRFSWSHNLPHPTRAYLMYHPQPQLQQPQQTPPPQHAQPPSCSQPPVSG